MKTNTTIKHKKQKNPTALIILVTYNKMIFLKQKTKHLGLGSSMCLPSTCRYEYSLLDRHCAEHTLVNKTHIIPALIEMKGKQNAVAFSSSFNVAVN